MLRAKRSYGSVLCGALAACALLFVVFASPASADLTYGVGWSGDYGGTENEMNEIAHSGATILRLPFDLSRCNGNNWAPCDSLVEKAALKGLTILPGLSWTKNGHNRFLLSEDPDWPTWGAWSQEVVERYGINGDFWYQHPSVPSHAIDAWEVWNEPNLTPNNPILAGGEEKVQPQNYGRFLKYTSEKVQAGSFARTGHGTEVLFGGLNMLAGNSISFLETASGVAGVPASYTAVSIHPYSFNGLVQEMTEKINSVRSALDDNKRVSGGSGKPLWITEIGWPVGGVGAPYVSEAEQASQLTQSINWIKVAEKADSIRAVVWYDQRDLGGQTHWDYFCGLRRVDGTYRPSWWAFQEETGVAPWPSPTVQTGGAIAVGTFHGTLTGTVNPNGLATDYHFDWGKTASYGHSTSTQSAGAAEEALTQEATIGVDPETLYHYRLVASNAAGTSYGEDHTFYSSPLGVFFADADKNNTMTWWHWNSTSGWQQTFLYGDAVAAGSQPAVTVREGTPHVFFVDASKGNTITDWTFDSSTGWQQIPFYGDPVAAGASPSATTEGGVTNVFFTDAAKGNTITDWEWTQSSLQQIPFYGDPVAAGTSPSATVEGGTTNVFFSDASNANTITDWEWTQSSLQQVPFYGDAVAAGTSPSATVEGGTTNVFFSDASNANTITDWEWTQSSLQQIPFYGDPVAAGTSPSATVEGGTTNVFFSDASNANTITDWEWTQSSLQQIPFYGDPVAAGTSPSATVFNGTKSVFFVDDARLETISRWMWKSTTVEQQLFFGDSVAAGGSPGAF